MKWEKVVVKSLKALRQAILVQKEYHGEEVKGDDLVGRLLLNYVMDMKIFNYPKGYDHPRVGQRLLQLLNQKDQNAQRLDLSVTLEDEYAIYK